WSQDQFMNVDGGCDRRRELVAPRALDSFLRGDRREGGAARRVLDWLHAERRDQTGGAHLLDPATPPLHLLRDVVEGAGTRSLAARLSGDRDAKQGNPPSFIRSSRTGHGRPTTRRRRLAKCVPLHAIAERVARDLQARRSPRQIPAGRFERIQQTLTL